jgi:hypothetical protein
MFGVHGPPSPGSIWITTGLGDVFVFDPAILEVRSISNSKKMPVINVFIFMLYCSASLTTVSEVKWMLENKVPCYVTCGRIEESFGIIC